MVTSNSLVSNDVISFCVSQLNEIARCVSCKTAKNLRAGADWLLDGDQSRAFLVACSASIPIGPSGSQVLPRGGATVAPLFNLFSPFFCVRFFLFLSRLIDGLIDGLIEDFSSDAVLIVVGGRFADVRCVC